MKDQATADEDTSLKDRGLIAISKWLLCYHSLNFSSIFDIRLILVRTQSDRTDCILIISNAFRENHNNDLHDY